MMWLEYGCRTIAILNECLSNKVHFHPTMASWLHCNKKKKWPQEIFWNVANCRLEQHSYVLFLGGPMKTLQVWMLIQTPVKSIGTLKSILAIFKGGTANETCTVPM